MKNPLKKITNWYYEKCESIEHNDKKNIKEFPMKSLQKQIIITDIRRSFEKNLENILHLTRVTAPLFITPGTGINDNLNGTERPVTFDIPVLNHDVEIVHSLAKWKRIALQDYNISVENGIYTNMNAIRRDEELDELHSVYVDQWDWERRINESDRTIKYLKLQVMNIYDAILNVYRNICYKYNIAVREMPEHISFIYAEDLMKLYPGKTSKEAEYEYMKSSPNNRALFVMGIGDIMDNGEKYDGRSPDYDDWTLNGDLILWDEFYDRQIEISSMGIRVDKKTLLEQLNKEDMLDRFDLEFHQMIMQDKLPLSIGGGIGQSRLCMWILGCKHIKEVQESVWE